MSRLVRLTHDDPVGAPTTRVELGTVVAEYRVTAMPTMERQSFEAVGPGGMSVALDLVDDQVAAEPGFRRRFRRLARARAALTHPNLLSVFGWGADEHRPYLAMELSHAPTLAELLRRGPLDPATAVQLLEGVADALELARRGGLVDRTLAPETILVAPRHGGKALLGDLGITKPQHPGVLVELPGAVHYASPELLLDETPGPESHVYTLASILCECLTGQPPYSLDSRPAVRYAHLTEPPPVLTERRPELPAAIDAVTATAMAAEPRERFPSPRAFMRAAADALGVRTRAGAAPAGRGPVHDRPIAPSPGWTEPPWREGLRRSSRAAVLALAMALPVVVAGGVGYQAGKHEPSRSARGSQESAGAVAVERLQARRLAERRRLAAARSSPAQVAAAHDLAIAYGRTRSELPATRGEATLLAALRDAQRAYNSLASAARRQDRKGYGAAGQAVGAAERLLGGELQAPGA